MQITLNITIAILIGVGIFVLANFLGLLEGRNQGYKKRKKEEAEEGRTRVVIETPLPPPSPPVDNSLLKLSLDDDNQPRLDLDGQRVDTSRPAPEQRKRLIDLMVMMRPWIEAAPATSRPMAAQTPSFLKPAQTPPTAASVSQPKSTPGAAAPAAPSKEEASPTSMVGQIDAILQRMLTGTPLMSLGVRLIESPQGNVTVMVGANKYAGVGDVPDPQVQAAIRAAIAEWEKKFTPG